MKDDSPSITSERSFKHMGWIRVQVEFKGCRREAWARSVDEAESVGNGLAAELVRDLKREE